MQLIPLLSLHEYMCVKIPFQGRYHFISFGGHYKKNSC